MAGVSSVSSIKQAKEILNRETAGTVQITANDGEYRVNLKGGREATAAYDTDLTSAVDTGIAMYRKGAWGKKVARPAALRALMAAIEERIGFEVALTGDVQAAYNDVLGAE